MKLFKKVTLIAALTAVIAVVVTSCGSNKDASLTIGYQNGLAYAPIQIIQEQGLIEKYYGDNIEVQFSQVNSGAAINEGFASGDIQVGAMGTAPAITAVQSGVPCKIFTGVSEIPNIMYTNDLSIKSLKDIDKDTKIATVNIGSIQHILLGMACKKEFGDAHYLDNNIVAMGHPDGETALLSGSVDCHLTSAPFTFQEASTDGISEVYNTSEMFDDGYTFIVGICSTELYDDNPDLYKAVSKAFTEAMKYIEENPEDAADICYEFCGCKSAEECAKYFKSNQVSFNTELKGVMTIADFMANNDFLEVDGPSDISDLVFDGVKGN